MKAAFKKFEDERLPQLKEEYPTFKFSQLQEKLFKEVSQNCSSFGCSGRKVP
jgi:Coiled-coil domain-containing protein 124 /Oxs1